MSIQAFNAAGRLKLYIGVEMTTSSAASSSSVSSSETLRAALCSGSVLVGSGEGAGDPGQIDVGDLGGGPDPESDLAATWLDWPLGSEVIAEFARDGMVAARADIDL